MRRPRPRRRDDGEREQQPVHPWPGLRLRSRFLNHFRHQHDCSTKLLIGLHHRRGLCTDNALEFGIDSRRRFAQPTTKNPHAFVLLGKANVHHFFDRRRLLRLRQRARRGQRRRVLRRLPGERAEEHRHHPETEQQPHPEKHSASHQSPVGQQKENYERKKNAEDEEKFRSESSLRRFAAPGVWLVHKE